MAEEMDFFQQLAEQAQEEAPPREELPIKAWVVGRTATEANGGAAPKIRVQTFTRKKEGRGGEPVGSEGTMTQLSLALYCAGGDPKIQQSHKNRSVFFEADVYPFDEGAAGGPLSGKLAGFLNACFACGVGGDIKDAKERAKVRWAATVAKLAKVAKDTPILDGEEVTLGSDKALYVAKLAVVALRAESFNVLFLTKDASYDKGGSKVEKVGVGSVEEYTKVNASNRKVTAFADDNGVVPEPFEQPSAAPIEY